MYADPNKRVKPPQGAVGAQPAPQAVPVAPRAPLALGGTTPKLAATPSLPGALARPAIQSTVAAFQPSATPRPGMTHPTRPGANYSPPALAQDGLIRKPDGYVSALEPSLKKPAGQGFAAAPVTGPVPTGQISNPLATPGFLPAAAAPPVQDRTMLGPLKRPQAPGEVGRSVGGRQLPGAPTVGADGSIVYDDAFMKRNSELAGNYAQKVSGPLAVSSTGPGVAASMVTGGNMPNGPLSRPPRGFTAEDRASQLDSLDRLGRGVTERHLREQLAKAASNGDWAGVSALSGATSSLASPPLEPMKRAMSNSAAAQGTDAARLAMEQDKASMDGQQQGIAAQQQQIQLQQAQQMQALSEQLLAGDKEAAAKLAALQGTKPGQPLQIERQVPMGTDNMGTVQFQKQTGIYDAATGTAKWFDGGQAGKQLPAGVTPQNAIADAQAALAAGAPREAIAAELAQYGLSL